jgi:WD40 repeat protein
VLATLEGHTEAVMTCAVTADGRWVVSASEDRTLSTAPRKLVISATQELS